MQEANAIPHSVGQAIYTVVVFLSGTAGGTLIQHLLLRRKLNLEGEANAAKAKAEARHLDSETIDKAYERIEQLHEIIDQLRAHQEKDRLEMLRLSNVEYLSEQQKNRIAQMEVELTLAEQQIKKMNGFIHAKGLHMSDLDQGSK